MGRVLLGVFDFSADEVPESIADDRDHVLLVDQDLELLFEVPVVIGLFAWVSDALLNISYNSLHFNFLWQGAVGVVVVGWGFCIHEREVLFFFATIASLILVGFVEVRSFRIVVVI